MCAAAVDAAGVVVPHPEEAIPALALKPGSVRHSGSSTLSTCLCLCENRRL
jgi:hypothetical protein